MRSGSIQAAAILGAMTVLLQCLPAMFAQPALDDAALARLAFGSVRGTVVDGAGRPVEGAYVQLAKNREADDLAYFERSLKTDAAGRFALADARPGRYEVTVQHDDHCGLRQDNVLIAGGAEATVLRLVLSEGITITGRVVAGRNGKLQGVAGVTVWASGALPEDVEAEKTASATNLSESELPTRTVDPRPFTPYRRTISDDRGEFRLKHVAADVAYRVVAQKDNWRSVERDLRFTPSEVAAAKPLEVILPLAGLLRGRVLDDAQAPVANALVRVVAQRGSTGQMDNVSSSGPPTETRTTIDGQFQITDVPRAGDFCLLVTADGWAPEVTEALSAADDREALIVLSRGSTLTGRVIAGDGGQPAAGVAIRIEGGPKFGSVKQQAVTDSEGNFSVGHFSDGAYILGGVRRAEQDVAPLVVMPTEFSVKEGREARPILQAHAPATIRGHVQDNQGKPLDGVEVEFVYATEGAPFAYRVPRTADFGLAAEATSDATGRYEVTGLLPGRLDGSARRDGYVLSPNQPGQQPQVGPFDRYRGFGVYGYTPTPRRTAVGEPGRTTDDVRFLMVPTSESEDGKIVTIRGQVVDMEERPAGGVRVYAYYPTGGINGSTIYGAARSSVTDAQGQFTITDQRRMFSGLAVLPTDEMPYFGRGNARNGVTIELEPTSGLAGTVVDENDRPIVDAMVSVSPMNRFPIHVGDGPRTSVATDSDGNFEIKGLPPGVCRLSVSKSGYQSVTSIDDLRLDQLQLDSGMVLGGVHLQMKRQRQTPAFEVKGRLVDQSGAPLGGWRVADMATGPDGRFTTRLYPSAATAMSINARAGDHSNSESPGLRLTFHSPPLDATQPPPAEFQFVVDIGGRITGRFLIDETGRPPGVVRAGMSINYEKQREFQAAREWPESGPPRATVSQFGFNSADLLRPDGSFEITHVPPGEYLLTLTGEGISEFKTEVHVGDANERSRMADLGVVRLPAGRVVSGRLIDVPANGPLSGAKFRLMAQMRRSSGAGLEVEIKGVDHEGRFELRSLPPDVTEIDVFALNEDSRYMAGVPNRAERFAHVKDISTARPDVLDLGEIRLQHYQIIGRLVNMVTLRPTGSIRFSLESRHAADAKFGTSIEHAKSGEDSRIQVDRLRLDAPVFDLKVDGYLPKVYESLPEPRPDGVIDLGDIALDPGQTVWGVLRGPKGEVVKRGRVGVRDVSGKSQDVDTDDQGVFIITGLLPGEATAYASAHRSNGSDEWIIVSANNQGVHLSDHRFKIESGVPAMLDLRLPAAVAK